MAILTCDADTCTYNKQRKCCKGDIMVGGNEARNCMDTCCDSFRREGTEKYKSALDHPSDMISIDCEASNCKYNSNYKCFASKVLIGGKRAVDHRQTCCETFEND